METYMKNLSFVHHFTSLSPLDGRIELSEKASRLRAGMQVHPHDEELLCPKPRRMALTCCAPDFIRPVCQWQSPAKMGECDAGCEILEIILKKGACGDGEMLNFGCSPPYCSPPTRSSNPIVHDARFSNQRPYSPIPRAEPKAMPSSSSNPSVRIEGFDCPRRDLL